MLWQHGGPCVMRYALIPHPHRTVYFACEVLHYWGTSSGESRAPASRPPRSPRPRPPSRT